MSSELSGDNLLPPDAAAAVAERCQRLTELGVSRLSAYMSPDGRAHVTFHYSAGGSPNASTFNGREIERAELLDALRSHLERALPTDGTPVDIDVC